MKKTGIFLKICCALVISLVKPSPGEAQYFANYNPDEELFTYEVKVIDEFIERFNDDPNSFLRNAYKKENKPYDVSKTTLLISLFNLENTSLSADTAMNDFFRKMLGSNPPRLSFRDSDWYADANCVFLYHGRQVELSLVLHVRGSKKDGSKWMIEGIGDTVGAHNPLAELPPKVKRKDNFIPTNAHVTNFMDFQNIFNSEMNPDYFFEPELVASQRGQDFISLVKTDKIQFQYVKEINYHFLKVPGWVFEVSQFQRKARNSGWLINRIKKVSDAEKENYKKQLLHS